jgi:hypothetical protein
MGYDRKWMEEHGSEDSHGRALWALGVGARRTRNEGHRNLCEQLFDRALPAMESFTSPRAWAFGLLGLHEYLGEFPHKDQAASFRETLTRRLVDLWKNCSDAEWPWFESSATYDNARLCQALILGGKSMSQPETTEIGLASLRWLASLQKTQAGHFRPIGSNGFCVKGGARADFDQQPVEAQAMVSACISAFSVTRDPSWSAEAKLAFEWFLGRNDLAVPLYDSKSGGCGDGLHIDRVSENQGAESTLAFHLSLAEMKRADHLVDMPVRS